MKNIDVKQLFKRRLAHLYDDEEINALFFSLFQFNHKLSRIAFELNKEEAVLDETLWLRQLNDLEKGKPLQYITEQVEFYHLPFRVSPAVLIPRPETEELVDLMLREEDEVKKKVLDIGTGSGCIAISLQTNRKNWESVALDASPDALEVAKHNANINHANIDFRQADICAQPNLGRFDVIVSNPPYIPPNQANAMHKNVLDYEPKMALFTPKDDALYFYKCIAQFAELYLNKPGGKLYFETHYDNANEVAQLFY